MIKTNVDLGDGGSNNKTFKIFKQSLHTAASEPKMSDFITLRRFLYSLNTSTFEAESSFFWSPFRIKSSGHTPIEPLNNNIDLFLIVANIGYP